MEHVSSSPPQAPFHIEEDGNRLALEGTLDVHAITSLKSRLDRGAGARKPTAIDLHGVRSMDTAGALFLCEAQGRGVELARIRPEHRALLDLICGLQLKPLPQVKTLPRWRQLVIQIGKGAVEAWRDAIDIITFIGHAASATAYALVHPHCLRPASVSRQVEDTGIYALPIIGLMAIMIAVVLGYQGVAQLRPYGGEDFTINLVAVSVLREMGVLITAIMVAGRSGSAFTAEIGVMKAREEIDALSVMGMSPMQLLVVPRLIGLVIALPLLTFFADVMGLLGGAVICHSLLDVSLIQYMQRVHQAVDGYDLFVGLFKAPIFAFCIAAVGCMHGLRVEGSAESVGQATTRAVVKSIFLVIVLDAFFSIWFEKLGI